VPKKLVSETTKIMGISIAAITIAGIAIIIASYSLGSVEIELESEDDYVPQTREIYLFTQVDEHIDEDALEIPPDQFSHDSIVVKEGDKVRIHFFNLEPEESQEHHTFTINNPVYKIHYDINAGENTLIEFTATTEGVFDYVCTFHQPTMRGQLIVLDD